MSFNLKNLQWTPFKQRIKSNVNDSFTPKGYTSIAYTRDTATAALACAEALTHPGLDKTLIDDLLLTGLNNNLALKNVTSKENSNQEVNYQSHQLLADAKQSLHAFYEQSKTENSDFKDIIDAANAECDIEFLQLVTGLFTKEFVNQKYTART